MIGSQLGIIPVKSESKWPKGLGGVKHLKQIIYVVLFLALATILFSGAEQFYVVLIEGHLSNIPRRFK